ncbi:MAG UNVERIFIED_CONTAM: hypothetical protein LVR18_38805 [Planctomycetaceae bacterium]|jgi:hypothetical protein
MLKSLTDFVLVLQNGFGFGVLERFREQQFHGKGYGSTLLDNFPDLSRAAGSDAVFQFEATDKIGVFSHASGPKQEGSNHCDAEP